MEEGRAKTDKQKTDTHTETEIRNLNDEITSVESQIRSQPALLPFPRERASQGKRLTMRTRELF
jgi:hypothetical protein